MVDVTAKLPAIITGAAKPLASRDVHTVGDVLRFLPTRYRSYDSDLGGLVEGDVVVVIGEVLRSSGHTPKYNRRGWVFTAVLTDPAGRQIDMTFFNRGHDAKLHAGVKVIAGGEVTSFNGRVQLAHPGYSVLEEGADTDFPGLLPIYPPVPKLHNWNLIKAIRLVLDSVSDVPDPIPAEVRARHRLVTRDDAYRMLHRPQTWGQVERARARMRFEEAFVLQCILATRRAQRLAEVTVARTGGSGELVRAFDARLPFTLTDGQGAVAAEVSADLARPTPMHRLLQGEVGSGKTVIAVRAMLAIVDGGAQAALLAPTEVLAAQHYRTITALMGDLAEGGLLGGSEIGTKVTLLTGSMSSAARRQAFADIASGEAGIVVGTHALIQDKVAFFDLALIVIDEQHRFGVEQRDALRGKADRPPHVLVMTATPIPRTVAMTVFGDMDTSTLRELPGGRSPISTHVVDEGKANWVDRMWLRLVEQCQAGRQAYVVCPRIGDDEAAAADDEAAPADGATSDDADLESLVDLADGPAQAPPAAVLPLYAAMRADPRFAGLRIGLMHGRLPTADKDAVMASFTAGNVDVLVSTTVIEVGVDVPNATVMVIKDADRFGVSQLHQLRGRVGRGAHPGLCFLATQSAADATTERLSAVAATTDGFALALLDMTQRREGDVLGTRQSGGRGRLRFLSLIDDEEVIDDARAEARTLLAVDPTLSAQPELARAISEWLEPDVAAYLEKS